MKTPFSRDLDLLTAGAFERIALAILVLAVVWLATVWALA
jgi:hypothetical protein